MSSATRMTKDDRVIKHDPLIEEDPLVEEDIEIDEDPEGGLVPREIPRLKTIRCMPRRYPSRSE